MPFQKRNLPVYRTVDKTARFTTDAGVALESIGGTWLLR
jgi:hypothetical protein